MFSSTEADTAITHLFTGRPARSIRNRFIEKYLESNTTPLAWGAMQGLAARSSSQMMFMLSQENKI